MKTVTLVYSNAALLLLCVWWCTLKSPPEGALIKATVPTKITTVMFFLRVKKENLQWL